jgi:hypothetical protein
MGVPWKFVLPLLVVLPLAAFVAGSLVSTADDEPPARTPIVLRQDSDSPSPDQQGPGNPGPTRSTRPPDDEDDDDDHVVSPTPVDDDNDDDNDDDDDGGNDDDGSDDSDRDGDDDDGDDRDD